MSLDKARKQIDDLIEKVYIDPSIDRPEDEDKKGKVKISVDTSDEASTQFSPRSENEDYFYMTNKHGLPTNLKTVKVKVDSDVEESSDTVYGQGTNPKPEDETYLSLLKGTTKSKVKVTISKDEKRPDPAYKNVH